jgi:hypothetical protein
MNLMDDEDLKKSVIDQMMGEIDDVTSDSLKKKPGEPMKGVEISIIVSPRGEESPAEEEAESGDHCDIEGCEDPEHDHSERDAEKPEGEGDSYISQLMKKMG